MRRSQNSRPTWRDAASEINEPPGQGLSGTVQGRLILLTGRNRVVQEALLPPAHSGLECLVFNDAPAMQAATVGIAFGLNSDVAVEAADAVILESSLGKVDELIHIGRRIRSIALQSAVGGMPLSAIGMLAAAFGLLPAIDGAVAQELIDLVAVLNVVRMAMPTSKLRDL
jgi:cation transport ATPase